MGREVHLEGALRVPEVELQRQRRHQQEGEGGQQRQAVGRLDGLATLKTRSSEARMKAPATSPVMYG